ncbi:MULTISPECIES: hypothetical protein [Rhodococcus]|nr:MULTISPECIES: hypothetical protein [Rhodococcus]UZG52762.1 hypothetical protein ONE62_21660 [Rhodococcus opacus]
MTDAAFVTGGEKAENFAAYRVRDRIERFLPRHSFLHPHLGTNRA